MAKLYKITNQEYEPGHEPLICTLVSCENELTGQQRKFCSKECRLKCVQIKQLKEYKKVYASLDGWAGGPRGLISESSIKKNESFVMGDGRFVIDDYRVDPDIFAIAEANHEKYILDRNEHENRVVFDGLKELKLSYDENHDIPYATIATNKYMNNLSQQEKEDRVYIQRERTKKYYDKNRDKLIMRSREYYAKRKKSMALVKNKPNTDTPTKS